MRNSRTTPASPKRRTIGLNDASIRGRLASSRPQERGDIGHVWREQKRLTEERWKLAPEDKPIFQDIKKAASSYFIALKKYLGRQKIVKKQPIWLKNLKGKIRAKPKVFAASFIAVIALLPLAMVIGQGNRNDMPQSLGASTEPTGLNDGKTEEKPTFTVLHPQDKKDLLEVTRRTPSGVLLHTFRDTLEGTEIEVTQQELPETFKSAPATELEKMAKNFQATDVIQVDQAIMYHGLDEKTQVQSLFTIKGNVLISIRSATKLSDEVWAAYFLALQ